MGKCWLVACVIFRLVFSMHASEREFCNCQTIPRSLTFSVYNRNKDLGTYNLNKDITIWEKEKIKPGDVIKFRCPDGSTLIGAPYLTCNGPDWSGGFPKCEKGLCWWANYTENNIEFYLNGSKILDFSSMLFPIGTTLKYIDKKQCIVERYCQENGTWILSQTNCFQEYLTDISSQQIERQPETKRVTDLAPECGNSNVTWGFAMAAFSAVFTCSLHIFTIIIVILMRRCKLNCFDKFTRSLLESSVDNGASKRLGPNSRIPETGHYQEAGPLASGYEIPRALNRAEIAAAVQRLDSSLIYEEIALNPMLISNI